MVPSRQSSLVEFLRRHDEEAWSTCLTELLPAIHEVDRTATQIWFAFFPLALARAFARADDPDQLARQLLIEGRYRLADQIDTSHRFLYGHRYWPEVKRAVVELARSAQFDARADLADLVKEVAGRVAKEVRAEQSLLAGIAAVAFMTVQQVGLDRFSAAPGSVQIDRRHAKRSPAEIIRERARDDDQGLFGFLRKADKRWTVTFDENDGEAKFQIIDQEEIASGAARDQRRDWRAEDPRCIEGPIPVQCRSAACGTCWVGVLGGAEKLTDVSDREAKRMKEFGYLSTSEPKPVIRLACMAQGTGAISIVIPPWNGVFGKYLQNLRAEETTETAAAG